MDQKLDLYYLLAMCMWPQISRRKYDICFSLSNLLYSVWQALGPSTSLQLTQIRSFLWLSNIPSFIHTTLSLSMITCSTPMSLLTSGLLICSFYNRPSVLSIFVHWELFRGFSASLWFFRGSVKTLRSLSVPRVMHSIMKAWSHLKRLSEGLPSLSNG